MLRSTVSLRCAPWLTAFLACRSASGSIVNLMKISSPSRSASSSCGRDYRQEGPAGATATVAPVVDVNSNNSSGDQQRHSPDGERAVLRQRVEKAEAQSVELLKEVLSLQKDVSQLREQGQQGAAGSLLFAVGSVQYQDVAPTVGEQALTQSAHDTSDVGAQHLQQEEVLYGTGTARNDESCLAGAVSGQGRGFFTARRDSASASGSPAHSPAPARHPHSPGGSPSSPAAAAAGRGPAEDNTNDAAAGGEDGDPHDQQPHADPPILLHLQGRIFGAAARSHQAIEDMHALRRMGEDAEDEKSRRRFKDDAPALLDELAGLLEEVEGLRHEVGDLLALIFCGGRPRGGAGNKTGYHVEAAAATSGSASSHEASSETNEEEEESQKAQSIAELEALKQQLRSCEKVDMEAQAHDRLRTFSRHGSLGRVDHDSAASLRDRRGLVGLGSLKLVKLGPSELSGDQMEWRPRRPAARKVHPWRDQDRMDDTLAEVEHEDEEMQGPEDVAAEDPISPSSIPLTPSSTHSPLPQYNFSAAPQSSSSSSGQLLRDAALVSAPSAPAVLVDVGTRAPATPASPPPGTPPRGLETLMRCINGSDDGPPDGVNAFAPAAPSLSRPASGNSLAGRLRFEEDGQIATSGGGYCSYSYSSPTTSASGVAPNAFDVLHAGQQGFQGQQTPTPWSMSWNKDQNFDIIPPHMLFSSTAAGDRTTSDGSPSKRKKSTHFFGNGNTTGSARTSTTPAPADVQAQHGAAGSTSTSCSPADQDHASRGSTANRGAPERREPLPIKLDILIQNHDQQRSREQV